MSGVSPEEPIDRTGRKPQARTRVSNGRQAFLVPTGQGLAARRWREIYHAISTDITAGEPLSEAEKQLSRRAATICIQCELMEARSAAGLDETMDLALYGMLTDRLGRVLQRLGIKRVPRDVTSLSLEQYLAREADE
jgi:hypothetical protein